MPGSSPAHPGEILNEQFLKPLGITPYRLPKGIGVHVRRISEIIKGNRNITPDTAIRLGLFFEVPARWWLEMQARFDTEGVPRIDELRQVVKPYDKLGDVIVTPKGARLLRRTECSRNHYEHIVFPGRSWIGCEHREKSVEHEVSVRLKRWYMKMGLGRLSGDSIEPGNRFRRLTVLRKPFR